MALSGSHFNAQDSKAFGLNAIQLGAQSTRAVIAALQALSFTQNNAQNHLLVRELLRSLEGAAIPESELAKAQDEQWLFQSLI